MTSLIHLKQTDTTGDDKEFVRQKLEKIARLTRENEELKQKLERLQVRVTMLSHPYRIEFFNARILNLELLESELSNRVFKRKEREKIIELIIQGAIEIWQMGELRAARFLQTYLYKEKKEQPKEEKQRFQSEEKETPKETPKTKPNIELKALYRKLVKLLHPDKEMDENKKIEKNILMKKVTEAYENEDLHSLLLIYSEVAESDEPVIGKIETYLRALDKKLKKLKEERQFIMKWGPLSEVYQNLYSRNPNKMEAKIKSHMNGIKDQIKKEEFFGDIYSDDLYLKAFLRELLLEEDGISFE